MKVFSILVLVNVFLVPGQIPVGGWEVMRAWYDWNALNTALVMLYCCSHTIDCFMFNPMSCSSVEVNIVQTLHRLTLLVPV